MTMAAFRRRPLGAAVMMLVALACAGEDLTLPGDPPGEATRLEVVQQPSTVVQSRVGLSEQPRVQVVDADGQPVDAEGITILASLASEDATLGGTRQAVTDESGVATFSDLWIDGPEGTYRLVFSAPGLVSIESREITIQAGELPAIIRIVEQEPDESDVGRSVRIEVAIEPANGSGAPTGDFEVRASTGEECLGDAEGLWCEFIFHSPGERALTAYYLGDGTFGEATSEPVNHVVNDVPNPTRTEIGVAPDPSPVGSPVTVYITVRGVGGSPVRGRVVVYGPGTRRCGEGPRPGSVELGADGEATLEVTGVPEGTHLFRGCFLGSPGASPSEDIATVTME